MGNSIRRFAQMMRYLSPPIVVPILILILVLAGAYLRMH
jgi:hypothetical protein